MVGWLVGSDVGLGVGGVGLSPPIGSIIGLGCIVVLWGQLYGVGGVGLSPPILRVF